MRNLAKNHADAFRRHAQRLNRRIRDRADELALLLLVAAFKQCDVEDRHGRDRTTRIGREAIVTMAGSLSVQSGDRIGSYVLREQLADDRTGVVWIADDESLDRQVVLRFPPVGTRPDEETSRRFERCARTLSRLDHPNLTAVHAIGEHGGRPFLVSALEGDRTLEAELEDGPFDWRRVLEIGIQVSSALAAAEKVGLVHGSLTPSSLVAGASGDVRLVNLGFANWSPDRGSAGRGEPVDEAYASPHQCAGGEASPACDLWALGVVLYRALAGRAPFEGDYPAAVMYAVQHDEPLPLEVPECPKLADAVMRTISKDPQRRITSADELHRVLAAIRSEAEETRPAAPVSGPRTASHESPTRRGWLALAAAGGVAVAASAWFVLRPHKELGRRTLAVLPLRDLSAGGDDFFVDGMTEELITSLAGIEALRVISRTSVMRFKQRHTPIPDVARELGVDFVLDGSAQQQGERIRIQAVLIDAREDRNVWSASYDRDLTDVFALQSEVSMAIAREIRVQLTPDEAGRLASTKRVRPETYEAYLRGLYQLNQRTGDSIERARDLFLEVNRSDPTFAPGFSGLADAYSLIAGRGESPPPELWEAALEAVEKAIELEPDLAGPHSTLGVIRSFYQWDWDAAGERYQEALRLAPGDATARQRYGIYLSRLGRFDEAVEEIRRAREIDPLSPTIAHSEGVVLYMARRFDEALARFDENTRSMPDSYRTSWYRGRCLAELGRYEEATEAIAQAVEQTGGLLFLRAFEANTRARGGDTAPAEAVVREIAETSSEQYVSPTSEVVVRLGLGQAEEALDALERAVEQRSGSLVWLLVDPLYDPLRRERRFAALLERVGLD